MRLVSRALQLSIAMRLYEDHSMSEIHRTWARTSTQADAARELFSIAFDRSFGNGVLYALRNAVVHAAEELITLAFSIWLNDPTMDDSTNSASIALGLSRSAFAGTDVRVATRREVSALSEDPDVLGLAGEALTEIELLNVALEPYLDPDPSDAVLLVWESAQAHFPTVSQAPTFVVLDSQAQPICLLSAPLVFWDYIVRRASAVEATRAASEADGAKQ